MKEKKKDIIKEILEYIGFAFAFVFGTIQGITVWLWFNISILIIEQYLNTTFTFSFSANLFYGGVCLLMGGVFSGLRYYKLLNGACNK